MKEQPEFTTTNLYGQFWVMCSNVAPIGRLGPPTCKKVRSDQRPDQIGSRNDLICARIMPILRASQFPRCFLSHDVFILIIAFNEFVRLLVES